MRNIFILTVALFICACSSKDNTVQLIQQDDAIPSEIKNAISEKDDLLVSAMLSKDTLALRQLFSERLNKQVGNNLGSILDQLADMIEGGSSEIIHQYYIVTHLDSNIVIQDKFNEHNAYSLNPELWNEGNFISLINFKTKDQTYLLTNVYGKYGESWKLDLTQFGPLAIGDKYANDFYEDSKTYAANEHVIDAANAMYICSQLMKPSGTYLTYENEDAMMQFYKESYTNVHAQHRFPDTLHHTNGEPIIASIIPKVENNEVIPEIKYLTNADVRDTLALNAQREFILYEIYGRYKGIDKNNPKLIMMAFPMVPDSTYTAKEYLITTP